MAVPPTSCAGVCFLSTYLLHAVSGNRSSISSPQGQNAQQSARVGPTSPHMCRLAFHFRVTSIIAIVTTK